jgi:hypothetical protein
LNGFSVDKSVFLEQEVLFDRLEDDILAVSFAEDLLLVYQNEILTFDSIALQLFNRRLYVNQFRIVADICQGEIFEGSLLAASWLRCLTVEHLRLGIKEILRLLQIHVHGGLDVVRLDELFREERLELLFDQGQLGLVSVYLSILKLVSLGKYPVVSAGGHNDFEVVVLAFIFGRNQRTVVFLR